MIRVSRIVGRLLGVVLLFIVITGAFITGGLAMKTGAYEQIPGISAIVRILDQPFFYPSPAGKASGVTVGLDVDYPFSFVVYGDSREIASSAKTAVIERVIAEDPDFVVHLGDMVSCGNAHQWAIFDLFEGNIRNAGIPFYPVLGNHEYRSLMERYPKDPEKQLCHYFKRFPFLKRSRWYEIANESFSLLVLDTGTDFSEGSAQLAWLRQKLGERKNGYCFVALHYPPHTRSGHGREMEKRLADIFESTNTLVRNPDIVFAGHVHNYERYRYGGVNYIVSGGGGAPPRSVERFPGDFYTRSGPTYHYCKVTVTKETLTLEMVRLNEGRGTWEVGDAFLIHKPIK
jgi:predicted phosphodiesterase